MKRPMIGLTPALGADETTLAIQRGILDVLLELGTLPVILPLTDDSAALADMADTFDAFIFTGGADIDGAYFGEWTRSVSGLIQPERDAMEIPLAALLHEKQKPVLGICRGMQVMNIALGGTIYQDIETDYGKPCLAHRQKQSKDWPSHEAAIRKNTLLSSILNEDVIRVNSLHHQAVKDLAEGLRFNAAAPDGIAEGLESRTHPFYLGVQWHPERMWRRDEASRKLFAAFVNAIG